MKIFAPLLAASANAATCVTISKDFSTVKNPTGHLDALNGCYGGGSGVETGTCDGTCFALFFTYKGLDGNGDTFYANHAERGCKKTIQIHGKDVEFPSATNCADTSNGCAITLTKDNYGLGNQGDIKGVYFQSTNAIAIGTKPGNGSPGFSGSDSVQNAPMQCLQCSSGLSLPSDARCFDGANAVKGHCSDFRSTSCFSRTSWYTAPKESTDAEYKMAERGCSTVPADEAKNRKISYFIGEVPREPEVDYELERREITEEYCDTVNCNDFKPTEKSTSGAAAFSTLTSLLIALAFNN
ncbi:Oidioi.mRNA.OKI2018_I69.chr2.g5105.t1.cds [Oikopleura dioica]|uniref:Oidioi.mRNA.OKI2018_I69.chr2.g5105.t1.cds n=1 Tax=Oikopleura dioica TaxID=34765 RepID=A0ABN7SZC5_OIKDI|nr:Oidioi.mRNA.OKI2018_I69.chr2.g5105.t1.cds [Oikopleura dioica]